MVLLSKRLWEGISGASVCVISDPYTINENYPCRTCTDKWWSNDPKDSIGYVDAGFFLFPIGLLTEGIHTICAQAEGYTSKTYDIKIVQNSFAKKIFYLERVAPSIPTTPDPDGTRRAAGEIAVNKEQVEGLEVPLYQGLNLFSYPLEDTMPYYAGEFLTSHDPDFHINGPQWFSGMRCYDKSSGRDDTCYFVLSSQNTWSTEGSDPSNPVGFPITFGEGYTVYMQQGKTLSFSFPPPNPVITLREGINWIGVPSPPLEYTSYHMLKEIGTPDEVVSISGYNPLTGEWESTYWEFAKPGGDNFPIISGKGYMVYMKKEKRWSPGSGF